MSFELSRTFDGSEIIQCKVVRWKSTGFLSGGGSGGNKKNPLHVHKAPQSNTFFGFGFEGKWEPQDFILNPHSGMIQIGMSLILIADIDAASQFPVEKEYAVGFPHEKKAVYVSGHVGLHLHCESTGEAFTLAFPNFELADVAFDAVNRLSYDQLSAYVFSGEADEDEDDEHHHHDGSDDISAETSNANLQLPKRLLKRDSSTVSSAVVKQKVKKIAKRKKEAAAKAAAKAAAEDDEDDDNFVASSGSELVERGRTLQLHEFTAHFLEGGGMGSLRAEAEAKEGKGPKGPPSSGVMRVRKETGSLSTWIVRMEPEDDEYIYFLKLSKALLKAPLNKIIRAANPSVAQWFGPVVPLRYDSLTIRSESYRSEFILEEVYTNEHGDKRVHRLICVFNSLEERLRWEEWFQTKGVIKKIIDNEKMLKDKKSKDEDGEKEGEGGASQSREGQSSSREEDVTIKLIWECFKLDEVWDQPKPLRKKDSVRRKSAAGQNLDYIGSNEYNTHLEDSFGEDDDSSDEDDTYYEDDGSRALPFVADTPRLAVVEESFASIQRQVALENEGTSMSAFENFSFAGGAGITASGRSREISGEKSPSSPTGTRQRSGSRKSRGGSIPPGGGGSASPQTPRRSQQQPIVRSSEELQSEQEALERCPWFAGYQPQKKNKWQELSKTITKERTAGSGILNAIKMMKSGSQFAREEDAGTMHAPGSPTAEASESSNKLSVILRARQLKKAMQQLENAEQRKAAGEAGNADAETEELKEQIAQIQDLNKIEEQAAIEEQQQQQQQGSSGTFGQQMESIHVDPSQELSPISKSASLQQQLRDEREAFLSQNQSSLTASVVPLRHDKSTGKMSLQLSQANNSNSNNEGGSSMNRNLSASDARTFQRHERTDTAPFMETEQQQQQKDDVGSPYSSGMFGTSRVQLFGALPTKFPQINLRSQGLIDENELQSSILRRNLMEPSYEGTSLQNSQQHHCQQPHHSSPAANESRGFRFGFQHEEPNNNNTFQSPKNTIMGDFSVSNKNRGGRKLPETSSDSDDESSQRFAKARAMRAVSQLGEEFVGVGFNSSYHNHHSGSPSSSSRRFPPTAATASSSRLGAHLSPSCPLCGGDRGSVAICRKTGRLHARM